MELQGSQHRWVFSPADLALGMDLTLQVNILKLGDKLTASSWSFYLNTVNLYSKPERVAVNAVMRVAVNRVCQEKIRAHVCLDLAQQVSNSSFPDMFSKAIAGSCPWDSCCCERITVSLQGEMLTLAESESGGPWGPVFTGAINNNKRNVPTALCLRLH